MLLITRQVGGGARQCCVGDRHLHSVSRRFSGIRRLETSQPAETIYFRERWSSSWKLTTVQKVFAITCSRDDDDDDRGCVSPKWWHCIFCFVVLFFITFFYLHNFVYRWNGLTEGSNDAVWRNVEPFEYRSGSQFYLRSIFTLKNSFWLGWELKTHTDFPAYVTEESAGKSSLPPTMQPTTGKISVDINLGKIR